MLDSSESLPKKPALLTLAWLPVACAFLLRRSLYPVLLELHLFLSLEVMPAEDILSGSHFTGIRESRKLSSAVSEARTNLGVAVLYAQEGDCKLQLGICAGMGKPPHHPARSGVAQHGCVSTAGHALGWAAFPCYFRDPFAAASTAPGSSSNRIQ